MVDQCNKSKPRGKNKSGAKTIYEVTESESFANFIKDIKPPIYKSVLNTKQDKHTHTHTHTHLSGHVAQSLSHV